ncbi:MAG: hypothetical protein HYW50_00810 [Candidatus Diapherotrites archaeon]|nr:hypothetical protein [Candidatus Diapherotrites archaeon]
MVCEGHLLCQTKLKVDFAIVLRKDPKELEKTLRKRGYGELKVLDNVFAEINSYCKKEVQKRYSKDKIIVAVHKKNLKQTTSKIIKEIEKRRKK